MSDDAVDELARHPGPLVFGEIHGTNEIPACLGAIVRQATSAGRAVQLCLEMPPSALVDDRSWFWHSHDGRSSTAIAGLIDTARRCGATVTGIETEHLSEAELARHEVHVADRLVGAVRAVAGRDTFTIALVGNGHSAADAAASFYATPPMAALAAGELPTLRTVRFEIDGGTAWVMTEEQPSGGIVTLPATQPRYARGLGWHDGLHERHHATWAIGPVTASGPARRRRRRR